MSNRTPSKGATAGSGAVAAPKAEKPLSPVIVGYLTLYNAFCMLGWGYINTLTALHLINGTLHEQFWGTIELPLKIVQTAAVLEIFHAAFGFVKSSAFVTFVQVMSRIVVLWAIVDISPEAKSTAPLELNISLLGQSVSAKVEFPFLVLMTAAWGLVEVPRYLYYLLSTNKLTIPYALEWLRYSLFIVLYPAGISGEVGCLLTAYPGVAKRETWHLDLPNAWNFAYNHAGVLVFLGLLYIPGSPFMINNMWSLRQKKMKALADAAKAAKAAKSE